MRLKKHHRIVRLCLALLGAVAASVGCERPATAPLVPGPVLHGSGPELVVRLTTLPAEVVEETIGPEGGTLAMQGGHSLHFPAGALAAPTLIRAASDGLALKTDFGPEGLVFPDSALPTLTYSYAEGTGLTDSTAVGASVVFLNDLGLVSEILTTRVDTVTDAVRARIGHFSTYALATN